tara:strand:+ start:23449 stop:25314 length:1866 start_codon:yes stop_codon:yes gene_type:complete
MDKSNKILSDVTVWNKYARYSDKKERRETYEEVIQRYEGMLNERYPTLSGVTAKNIKFVKDRSVLPSMRGLQFAGAAIEKNESRVYNCAFLPVDDYRAFSETMFLLLGGTGVGYSVQGRHVGQLPAIKRAEKSQKFVVEDSIEGWADAVKYLMKSYFGLRTFKPRFDFSAIRQKGERLVTAGGKAPGPEPLRRCLLNIELILERTAEGEQLTSVDCHDIQCHIADAVLAGGIRRAAMISLFDRFDIDMIKSKSGTWWETNAQRGRANNSAVLPRGKVTEEEFKDLWGLIKASGSGEPGVYWTNNEDWGTNPCCEIALQPFQFCNLTEVNVSDIETQEDLEQHVAVAAYFGTLQAGITDFHYLRAKWQQTTEEDALIGVGMTGIASGKVLGLDLKAAADRAKLINRDVARLIGINPAARVTTVKPSGSTSCVAGSSSGIHAWHADYYIRRMELSGNEALVPYLLENHSELIQPLERRPGDYVLEFPQSAPQGSIIRTEETAKEFLGRVDRFNTEWVREGHRTGDNCNNVSATCNIREDEWEFVGNWMWNKRDNYNGMSVLPYFEEDTTYTQMPFETITKERFDKMYDSLKDVDISKVTELEDGTTLTDNVACGGAGGSCEIV